jgi:hypothetical protein
MLASCVVWSDNLTVFPVHCDKLSQIFDKFTCDKISRDNDKMLVPLNTKFKGKIAKHIQVAVV